MTEIRNQSRWINGCDPRRYGLDFGLWTRSVVADLIERKFAVRLGVSAVGGLLAKLRLTPQQPLQRAYQPSYVASTKSMLTLHLLPGYAPELNPDELVGAT